MKPLFVALSLTAGLLASAVASGIEYPAGGNFETEEGTVEMWVTPTAKELFPPDDGKYHSIFSLFSTSVPGEWNLGTVWYRSGGQIGIKASMGSPKVPNGLTAILPGKELPAWDKEGVHHFAFVWKGGDMKMFADGKPAGSKLQAIGLSGVMAGQKILFGSTGDKRCDLILHAVRVSSVAKTPEQLADAKPEAEIYTLLFDKFDDPSEVEARKTNPEVIFSLNDKPQGIINGPVEFVAEPVPGISLKKGQ